MTYFIIYPIVVPFPSLSQFIPAVVNDLWLHCSSLPQCSTILFTEVCQFIYLSSFLHLTFWLVLTFHSHNLHSFLLLFVIFIVHVQPSDSYIYCRIAACSSLVFVNIGFSLSLTSSIPETYVDNYFTSAPLLSLLSCGQTWVISFGISPE